MVSCAITHTMRQLQICVVGRTAIGLWHNMIETGELPPRIAPTT